MTLQIRSAARSLPAAPGVTAGIIATRFPHALLCIHRTVHLRDNQEHDVAFLECSAILARQDLYSKLDGQ